MRKLTFILLFCFSFVSNAQDLISGGSNSWIFHTPDDTRTDLIITPKINGVWDWGKQIKITNKGGIYAKDIITSNTFRTMSSSGDILLRRHGAGDTTWRKALVPTYDNNKASLIINYDGDFNDGVRFMGDKTTFKGKVGVGTYNPDSKLTVKGKIHCEEVKVDLQVPADYVFEKYYTGSSTLKANYTMPTLEEVEAFTKKNNHLPAIPPAKEIQENGLHLKEMTNLLLQKIEELTLYTIEQEKRIKKLEKKLADKQ